MGKSKQSITASQMNTLRTMLNSLGGRPYDDALIDCELALLSKRQGVMLVKLVGQILKIRSSLKSGITMSSFQPLLTNLGISVSLAIG